jgi:hypothetical protein
VTQDTDLFVALAEIAGIFVAFGALISVTRRRDIGSMQVGRIQSVVAIGLLVIVAALIPVGLARYGLSDPTVWLLSSIAFLVLIWVSIFALREGIFAQARENPVAAMLFWIGLEIPIQVPLFLVVFGVHPALAPAFYTTALVINVFEAAFVLTQLVRSQVASPGH